jgi:glutamate-1-semialdehyde 2,1-aminomutase
LAGVREACTRAASLLVIDETHTLSAGPGGCTAAWDLEPDAVTLGKAIGGGVPIGAYGVSAALAERIGAAEDADLEDTGGVGGTLAGNALSLAAARATLAPWCVVSLGARAEYRFCPEPPRSGAESAAAGDRALEEYLHLYLLNRGVLITPFHNMALMCPATSEEDVDRHSEAFDAALVELFA